MVLSRLDPSVDYSVIRELDPDDHDFDAWVYDTEIDGEPVVVALGQAKYTYIDDNLVFFPAYLVEDGAVTCQIGVYEVLADQLPNKLDADGALDLAELGEPILYGARGADVPTAQAPDEPVPEDDPESADGSDDETARSASDEEAEEAEESEEAEEAEEADGDSATVLGEELAAATLEEKAAITALSPASSLQTRKEWESDRASYKPKPRAPWIQNFMRSDKYNIVDNEAGGDCLFASIRDALKGVGRSVSVAEMRRMLSQAVNESLFEGYMLQYVSAAGEEKDLTREIRELAARHRNMKKRLGKASPDSKAAIVLEAEAIGDRHEQAKHERQAARDLRGEFDFMKGITSLEAFRAVIQTCEFWGDTWALSTLERLLNVKLVLFSQTAYEDGDVENVLTCGQLNDAIMEEAGRFEPDYYILLNYSGDHYQRITFADATAFTFGTLPYGVKKLVLDKCLERAAGPYYIIPQFKTMLESTGDEPSPPVDLSTGSNAVLQFYASSSGRARPGRGTGESLVGTSAAASLRRLEAIKDWRKLLSNEGASPMAIRGSNWHSLQHYAQAAKFTRANPDFAKLFSTDSGSALSRNPQAARSVGEGKPTPSLLKRLGIPKVPPKDVKAAEQSVVALKEGLSAKFRKGTEAALALQATGTAALQRFVSRKKPEPAHDLMAIRDKLAASATDASSKLAQTAKDAGRKLAQAAKDISG